MLSLEQQLKSVQDRTAKRKLDKELRTKAAQALRANAAAHALQSNASHMKRIEDRRLCRIQSRILLNESDYSTENTSLAQNYSGMESFLGRDSSEIIPDAIDRDAKRYEVK
jgi:hypothetical protein